MKLESIDADLFYIVTNETDIRGPFSMSPYGGSEIHGSIALAEQPSGRLRYFGKQTPAFEHWSDAAEHVAVEYDRRAMEATSAARSFRILAKMHCPPGPVEAKQ